MRRSAPCMRRREMSLLVSGGYPLRIAQHPNPERGAAISFFMPVEMTSNRRYGCQVIYLTNWTVCVGKCQLESVLLAAE